MNEKNDPRTVLTLDAGGTNFVFSAYRDYKPLVEAVHLPAEPHDLDRCLQQLVKGFRAVKDQVGASVEAISFAFPGPADYARGVLGNLPNFNAFNHHMPLGPWLEEEFGLPVYINNDGNLFAYGEALAGFLPDVNSRIRQAGGIRQYHNLIGLTLGTGFGGGIVLNQSLLVGDSSCGAEVHNGLNKFSTLWNAEESVSTRAIQRVYAEVSGRGASGLMPRDIAMIARGKQTGDKQAARQAFYTFGEALGSSVAGILTLIDGLVVLGGGITAAWDLFAPAMFAEVNRPYSDIHGGLHDRLSFKVFNLEDQLQWTTFARGEMGVCPIPGTDKTIPFDSLPRTGIGVSAIGASHAIALGAYTFALQQLDKR